MNRVIRRNSTVCLCALILVLRSQGQDDSLQVNSPGLRATHSLVYDETNRQVILLDGTYPAIQPVSGMTRPWAWDGKTWKQLPFIGPGARYVSNAVYDSKRQRIIVYGGRVGKAETISGDTWEWDGKRWIQMMDTSIGKRDHQAMAYCEDRERSVVFGGGKFPRTIPWAKDTWEWDGKKWELKDTAGPLGRVTSMVYDKKNKIVVMFGGVGEPTGTGRAQPLYNDTWAWNGKVWKKLSGEGPPARSRFAMCYDDDASMIVLYGGEDGQNQLNDMWKWDGVKWQEIKLESSPGKRSLHAIAYDASRKKIILYGGNREGKVAGDTWEWDGKQWREIK